MKYKSEGKKKLLSFGPYPEVTLAEARDKRDAARKRIRYGGNLTSEKGGTFGRYALEYIQSKQVAGRSVRTIESDRWILEKLAKPLFERPIAAITSRDVLELIASIAVTGRAETASRLKSRIGSVLRHAARHDPNVNDVTAVLKGALPKPRVKHMPAITDPVKFKRLDTSNNPVSPAVDRTDC